MNAATHLAIADRLDGEADDVLAWADELEHAVTRGEADIQRRWIKRCHQVGVRARIDREVKAGINRLRVNEMDEARRKIAKGPRYPEDRQPGDDIAPPADIVHLLESEVKDWHPFIWCFVKKGLGGGLHQCEFVRFSCNCGRRDYIHETAGLLRLVESDLHITEMKGHTVRLANGHLRIVFLGRCEKCSRVHWFEVARPAPSSEIDNSVHVERDAARQITYINGSAFTDQELLLRRRF